MLELKNIKKRYGVGNTYVDALKGINLVFRNNEFVSVLGPSGCGKTTLLNIIGGLDKYSYGDLIIDGISTKNYFDRDWDNYRNHKIGFVFQSYNLIPHQTIVKNVELALTISGVKKQERYARAKEALKKVGLEGLEKKKPNQLSGGQMQRVAIARALVNNPSILLADEPTGALDSETSIQVMDLLKEVAKDRLVIMVTHNPDLAYKYSSRIVKMKDGLIYDDSNPCSEHDKEIKKNEIVKTKQSSMKLITATGLSFSNLLSKLKRTILITIAGSIGIVGVSAVLAVSKGVKNYINSMQEDMLSSYPLTISEETLDYSSLTSGLDSYDKKKLIEFDPTTEVGLDSMIDYLMSAYKGMTNVKTNDINANFLKYLEGLNEEDVAASYYNYGIDVTNNIFTSWSKDYLDPSQDEIISLNGLTNRYIAELNTVDGFSDYASYVSLFTDFMKQLPGGQEYITNQYDLLGSSTYATKENEIMLVVNEDTTFTDLYLAQLGFYDHDEFINIAKRAIEINALGNDITQEQIDEINEKYPYKTKFNYEELIGKELYYFPHDSIYKYGEYTSDPQITIKADLTNDSETYKLTYGSLMGMEGLSCEYVGTDSSNSFYLTRIGSTSITDISSKEIMYGSWVGQLDEEYIMFNITSSGCSVSKGIDMVSLQTVTPSLLNGLPYEYSATNAYYYESVIDENFINDSSNNCVTLKITGILRIKDDLSFGSLDTGVYYTSALAERYMSDAYNSNLLNDEDHGILNYIGSEEESNKGFECYVKFNYLDFTTDEYNKIESSGYSSALNSDLSSSFSSLFSGLTGINYLENDTTALRSLSGLKTITNYDSDNNITGYSYAKYPQEISIYPTSFSSKDNITSYLDKWNEDKEISFDNITLSVDERTDVSYSDTIGLIIGVIDVLINTITIALVAFTSLSLVVSCFMIAVITYISVMERVKEIGVIRSLGGRKKDISRLFISETFMTGLFSGLFGIGITYLLCLLVNALTASLVSTNMAILPIKTALIMIGLSVFLSVISGLIPSMKSANQDPVSALRSE